jgi:SWI/SNF-related matrix-associated actin-dependent regulator of chromatin subfamily A3
MWTILTNRLMMLLQDSMGLGKSCSMIALIANDLVEPEPRGYYKAHPTTLLVVPLSLISTWEEQFQLHLRKDIHFCIRRHHGSQRIVDIEQLRSCNVIITTYQTVEAEWRRSVTTKSPFLFSVYWQRIILDEAHHVRDRSTNISKAICSLQGVCRWAVTGTPLQNRLGDLATICQFLRVYPYHDPRKFDSDITAIWKAGQNTFAVARLKRLLRCILLRRSKGIVDLPRRTDTVISLCLNDKERSYYDSVKWDVVRDIDMALSSPANTSRSTNFNVLQKINELRLICNMGIHRTALSTKRTAKAPLHSWNPSSSQIAYQTLASSGPLSCSRCGLDLDTVEVDSILGDNLSRADFQPWLYECLRLLCANCFQQVPDFGCGHDTTCPGAPFVPTLDKSRFQSRDSSPTPSAFEIEDNDLPTKVKALMTDLLGQSSCTKRSVISTYSSMRDLTFISPRPLLIVGLELSICLSQ